HDRELHLAAEPEPTVFLPAAGGRYWRPLGPGAAGRARHRQGVHDAAAVRAAAAVHSCRRQRRRAPAHLAVLRADVLFLRLCDSAFLSAADAVPGDRAGGAGLRPVHHRAAADPKPARRPLMIDDQHHITTPEGVPLTLDLAGPLPRALAYFTDLAIRIVVYLVAAILFGLLGGLGNGLMLILIFLLEWFYPVWFEVMRHGQTPGKKAFGMTVVREDGTPVDVS